VKYEIIRGDCREVLADLRRYGEHFHACVTDPPYHLVSTVDRTGMDGMARFPHGYTRLSRGFMGKSWDGGDVAFRPETWRAVWNVLRPGGYLIAFGGTRTFHKMAVAIEDAGFEIRDTLMWLYGTGFPKSHDVSKGIDRAAGAMRDVIGRAPTRKGDSGDQAYAAFGKFNQSRFVDVTAPAPATPEAQQWSGWGTALKPAWEPILLARKPLIGTVAANVLAHGTGALNIDASRIGSEQIKTCAKKGMYGAGSADKMRDMGFRPYRVDNRDVQDSTHEGRWPANVLHDGSGEVLAAFASFGDKSSARKNGNPNNPKRGANHVATSYGQGDDSPTHDYRDEGTAARFFYCAKASKADRAGSKHPTVKPLALLRYLINLVTPPGGTVLDPFAGSGTTLQAAIECGARPTGIEADPQYFADIKRRMLSVCPVAPAPAPPPWQRSWAWASR
jgi:site-specific DNA-methyltransferase (adenine-specific)